MCSIFCARGLGRTQQAKKTQFLGQACMSVVYQAVCCVRTYLSCWRSSKRAGASRCELQWRPDSGRHRRSGRDPRKGFANAKIQCMYRPLHSGIAFSFRVLLSAFRQALPQAELLRTGLVRSHDKCGQSCVLQELPLKHLGLCSSSLMCSLFTLYSAAFAS